MLSTPAADRAMAMHRFEQSLSRALALGDDCPEVLLRPILETLFQIADLPAAPRRLKRAAVAAVQRIVDRLPAHKTEQISGWFAAIRSAAVAIPGSSLSTVN